MKKNLFFVLSIAKTKMSVKRKLNTKTLKEMCDILSHIEKGMTKRQPINLVYLKTPFQLGLKTKKIFFKRLKKVLQALRNLVVVNTKKLTTLCVNGLFYKGGRIPIDGSIIQEKGLFFAEKLEIPDFKASDGWLDKW